jgi:hypothetical protein
MPKRQESDEPLDILEVEETPEIIEKPVTMAQRIPISRYFDLHRSDYTVYIRAYMEHRFRGIMDTEESWEVAIRQETGGKG